MNLVRAFERHRPGSSHGGPGAVAVGIVIVPPSSWPKADSNSSISEFVHYRLFMSSSILIGVLLQSVAVFAEPDFPASEGA